MVYRPVFIREYLLRAPDGQTALIVPGDMALGGPYFNYFLLNVICANVSDPYPRRACMLKHQAARYSDYYTQSGGLDHTSINGQSTPALNWGSEFLNRAKLLLAGEMDKVSDRLKGCRLIPAIQRTDDSRASVAGSEGMRVR